MDTRPIKEQVRDIAARLDGTTDAEVFRALRGVIQSATKSPVTLCAAPSGDTPDITRLNHPTA